MMIRRVVVLPAPLGPSRPKTSPAGTPKDMPRSAWVVRQDQRKFLTKFDATINKLLDEKSRQALALRQRADNYGQVC